jgi:hypothetical protein
MSPHLQRVIKDAIDARMHGQLALTVDAIAIVVTLYIGDLGAGDLITQIRQEELSWRASENWC